MTGQSMAMGHGPELRAPSGPVSWPELRAHAGVELYVLHVIPHVIPSSDPDTHTVGIINGIGLNSAIAYRIPSTRPNATSLSPSPGTPALDVPRPLCTGLGSHLSIGQGNALQCADAAPRIRSQLVPPIIPPRSAHQRQRGGNKRKAVQAPALGYKGRYV